MPQRAWCIGCNSEVALDDNGFCPQGHSVIWRPDPQAEKASRTRSKALTWLAALSFGALVIFVVVMGVSAFAKAQPTETLVRTKCGVTVPVPRGWRLAVDTPTRLVLLPDGMAPETMLIVVDVSRDPRTRPRSPESFAWTRLSAALRDTQLSNPVNVTWLGMPGIRYGAKTDDDSCLMITEVSDGVTATYKGGFGAESQKVFDANRAVADKVVNGMTLAK